MPGVPWTVVYAVPAVPVLGAQLSAAGTSSLCAAFFPRPAWQDWWQGLCDSLSGEGLGARQSQPSLLLGCAARHRDGRFLLLGSPNLVQAQLRAYFQIITVG